MVETTQTIIKHIGMDHHLGISPSSTSNSTNITSRVLATTQNHVPVTSVLNGEVNTATQLPRTSQALIVPFVPIPKEDLIDAIPKRARIIQNQTISSSGLTIEEARANGISVIRALRNNEEFILKSSNASGAHLTWNAIQHMIWDREANMVKCKEAKLCSKQNNIATTRGEKQTIFNDKEIWEHYQITKQTFYNVIKKYKANNGVPPEETRGRKEILPPNFIEKICEASNKRGGASLRRMESLIQSKVVDVEWETKFKEEIKTAPCFKTISNKLAKHTKSTAQIVRPNVEIGEHNVGQRESYANNVYLGNFFKMNGEQRKQLFEKLNRWIDGDEVYAEFHPASGEIIFPLNANLNEVRDNTTYYENWKGVKPKIFLFVITTCPTVLNPEECGNGVSPIFDQKRRGLVYARLVVDDSTYQRRRGAREAGERKRDHINMNGAVYKFVMEEAALFIKKYFGPYDEDDGIRFSDTGVPKRLAGQQQYSEDQRVPDETLSYDQFHDAINNSNIIIYQQDNAGKILL